MHIGEKIKHFRELWNFTQKYMAEQVEISQPHYSRIENGQDFSYSQLEKIADVLDIKVQDLISFEPAQYFNNVQNSQIGYNFYNNNFAQELEAMKEKVSKLEQELKKGPLQ